jgi:hypothetical protein
MAHPYVWQSCCVSTVITERLSVSTLNTAQGTVVHFPRQARNFLLKGLPHELWDPSGLLFSGYHRLFPLVKWPVHYNDHSPPSSVKLKNKWSYTSTFPYAFRVSTRETFIFTFEPNTQNYVTHRNRKDANKKYLKCFTSQFSAHRFIMVEHF